MKWTLRRLRPGEPDWELVWAAVLGVTGVLAAIWLNLRLPTPECVVYRFTGVPCLSCGGTRATRALLSGDFVTAFAWNPLVTIFVILVGIYFLYAVAVTVCRLPRIRGIALHRGLATALRVASVVFLTANWVYLVATFSGRH